MSIPITGLFAPSGGAGAFDLYDPADIQAGNVNVVLQAIAGGKFAGGSHATAPAGEVVCQVKTTTGAPSHSATEGTLCWNSVDDALYCNSNGTTGWTAVGGGGGTPGGSTTQVQYNNAGAFGGITGATTNGTALTLVAPVLGTPASGTLTNCTGLPVAGGGTGAATLADGGIVCGNGTGAVEVVAPGATTTILVGGGAATAPVWTTATGSGAPVRATSPTLVTPLLGTPTSGTLTNCLGLPIGGLTSYGPIPPDSAVPDISGEVYPDTWANAGATRYQSGLAVTTAALLTADRTWFLDFPGMAVKPGGTLKLVMGGHANAVTGDAVFAVNWASYAAEEDPLSVSFFGEGNQTISWAAGDTWVRKELKVTLDADTYVAGERITMNIVAVNASWTLAAISVWNFNLIYE